MRGATSESEKKGFILEEKLSWTSLWLMYGKQGVKDVVLGVWVQKGGLDSRICSLPVSIHSAYLPKTHTHLSSECTINLRTGEVERQMCMCLKQNLVSWHQKILSSSPSTWINRSPLLWLQSTLLSSPIQWHSRSARLLCNFGTTTEYFKTRWGSWQQELHNCCIQYERITEAEPSTHTLRSADRQK